MNGLEYLNKLQSINVEQEFIEVVERQIEFVPEYNRSQLLKGINADGAFLPRYRDDPFFETPREALAYQRWKRKISPFTRKPETVMDFFINGWTHDHINAAVHGKQLSIYILHDFGSDIDAKTGNKAMGLTKESREELYVKELLPLFVSRVKDKLE